MIVIGLYLVIWGSSKGQSESTDVVSELPLHKKQTVDTNPSSEDFKVGDVENPKTISGNNVV